MEPSSIPEQTLEELTLYVLDELPPDRRGALEQELARCPELREEHAMLQQVLVTVAEETPDSAPLTDVQRNQLRVAAGAAPQPAPLQHLPTGRWLIPLAMAASLVLTAFLVVFVNDDTPTRTGDLAQRNVLDDFGVAGAGRELREEELLRQAGAPSGDQDLASKAPDAKGMQEALATKVPETTMLYRAVDPPENQGGGLQLSVVEVQAGTQAANEAARGAKILLAQTEVKLETATVQPPADAAATTYGFGINPTPLAHGASPITGGGGGGSAGPGAPAPTGRPTPQPTAGQRGFYLGGKFGDVRARGETEFGAVTDQLALMESLTQLGDLTMEEEAPDLETKLGLYFERPDDGRRPVLTVDEIFQNLSRRPGETPDMMFFRYWGDNPSVRTELDPLSTFALDVDTASYSLIRNYLSKGILPPKEAVRTEEFVNSFSYDLTPAESGVFALSAEVGPSPFGSDGMQLVRVGLKAKEVTREERKPVALTFVIDVSGSMERENRLELVKQALHLLVGQFDERDTIGIVTFQASAEQVLAPHSIQHKNLILGAIDGLHAEGSTNAGDGLLLGYQMALTQFRDEAENRILLLSDGVANTGITDVDGIFQSVEKYREGRIYLNSVGVGMGNHNDALLEQLADKGDGFYAYVDTMAEAEKVFVDRLVGSMQTVAKDARVQMEWNPDRVKRYRLLGYENRAVADQDFRSTSIDAGEIGAGHEVTALYEIEARQEEDDGPLGTLKLFFQEPETDHWIEQQREITDADGVGELGLTSPSFRLAVSVAEFAEILRQSIWSRDGSLGEVLTLAEPLVQEFDGNGDVSEFVALVRQAAALPDLLPVRTDLTRTVNEFKRNQHLQAMLDDLKHQQDDPLLRQLEEDNRKLEQRIRDLIEQRRKDR